MLSSGSTQPPPAPEERQTSTHTHTAWMMCSSLYIILYHTLFYSQSLVPAHHLHGIRSYASLLLILSFCSFLFHSSLVSSFITIVFMIYAYSLSTHHPHQLCPLWCLHSLSHTAGPKKKRQHTFRVLSCASPFSSSVRAETHSDTSSHTLSFILSALIYSHN